MITLTEPFSLILKRTLDARYRDNLLLKIFKGCETQASIVVWQMSNWNCDLMVRLLREDRITSTIPW